MTRLPFWVASCRETGGGFVDEGLDAESDRAVGRAKGWPFVPGGVSQEVAVGEPEPSDPNSPGELRERDLIGEPPDPEVLCLERINPLCRRFELALGVLPPMASSSVG